MGMMGEQGRRIGVSISVSIGTHEKGFSFFLLVAFFELKKNGKKGAGDGNQTEERVSNH